MMGKQLTLTPLQLVVLLLLAGLIVVICSLIGALVYADTIVVRPTRGMVPVASTPLTSAVDGAFTPTSPTIIPTSIPTYAYRATSTALPSPTGFVWTPPAALSKSSQSQPQPQSRPAPTSSSSSGGSASYCAALLDYAAAMHQYYLDMIDYRHARMIQYYERQIWQASLDRDALRLVQLQRSLDAEKAQVRAEKASENQRYRAERASIQASCG